MEQSLLWKSLIKIQEGILIACSVAVVLAMCAVVLMRYVFQTDLFGIDEIVVIVAFWLYFIGASYGSYDKSHVKADLISRLLSENKRQVLNIVIYFIMVCLCFLFTYWSVDFVRYSVVELPRSLTLQIPLAVGHGSVFLGYLLMTFYCSVYFIKEILCFRERTRSISSKHVSS